MCYLIGYARCPDFGVSPQIEICRSVAGLRWAGQDEWVAISLVGGEQHKEEGMNLDRWPLKLICRSGGTDCRTTSEPEQSKRPRLTGLIRPGRGCCWTRDALSGRSGQSGKRIPTTAGAGQNPCASSSLINSESRQHRSLRRRSRNSLGDVLVGDSAARVANTVQRPYIARRSVVAWEHICPQMTSNDHMKRTERGRRGSPARYERRT